MDRILNILHISDVHLHASSDFAQNLILDAFIEDLGKLETLNLKPDLVVVSGDLAKAADDENAYSNFLNFLIKIQDLLKLKEDQFVFCPGNHDVSRQAVGPALPTIQQWRNDAADRDKANSLLSNPNFINQVYKTFKGFYDLEASFNQSYAIKTGPFYTSYFFREFGLSVAVINTATLSTAGLISVGDDERKLVVPERMLMDALSVAPKDSFKIVVGHHPTSWLNENNEDVFKRLLGKSADMYMCGHIHKARPETVTNLLGQCYFGQTGALYEWRDHWCGYCVYQVGLDSRHVKSSYRRWFEDRREFSKAEELGDDGVVFSSAEARQFFATAKLRISTTDLEAWRQAQLLPALGPECSKSLAPVPIEDAFVAPEFVRDLPKASDDLNLTPKREVITFDDAIDSESNFVISAPAQSGRSTLLRQWAFRVANKPATHASWTAPVLLNFSEFRDYPAYIESLVSRQLPQLSPSLGGSNRMLEQGKITLLVDDVDFQDRKKLKAFGDFMEKFPSCRYVVTSVDILFEGASVSPVIHDKIPFKHVQLRPLKRKDLLSLINGHNVVDSEPSAHALLERVTREAKGLNVPLNPVTASFLIQIFGTEPDRILVNRATLVERYIELLLQKFSRPDVELRSFDFKLKRDLLSKIAQLMVESDDHEPTYNEVLQVAITYVNYFGFPQDASQILQHFISCRILEKIERGEETRVRFSLSSFFHYFVAFRMTEDERFKGKIFDPLNYLSFAEEVTFYAALARNDGKLLDYVFEAFAECGSEMWADASDEVKNGSVLDNYSEPNAEATEEELFAIEEVIRSNEQLDSAREHHLNGQLEDKATNQKIRRPQYRTVGDQWVAHLFLASQVLKHMELVPHDLKKKHLRTVVRGWLQFCAFSLTLVPRLITDKTVEINGVLYKLNINTHEPVGEVARRISLVMPIVTSYMATSALGSEKLKLQLKDGLGGEELTASEQLLRALLLADIGVPGIADILKTTSKSVAGSPYLKKVLLRKLYDVAIRFRLEGPEVDAVRNLASDLLGSISGYGKGSVSRERVIDSLRKQRLLLDRER